MIRPILLFAILLNFGDFTIFNIAFSFIVFVPLFLYFLKFFNFNKNFLLISIFLVLLGIILYLFGLLTDARINLPTLIMMSLFFVFVSANVRNKDFTILQKEIVKSKALPIILLIQPIFTLLQFFEFTFLGSFYLLNPFGSFSHPGPVGADLFTYAGNLPPYEPSIWTLWPRPNSTFSEPSTLAMVLIISLNFFLWIYRDSKRTLFIMISLFAIISTLTATGIILASISFGVYFNERSKLYNFQRILIGFSMIFIVTLLVAQLGYFDRWDEFNTPGKSGHIRITGPIEIILSSLYDNPIGIPAGNTLVIENADVLKDSFGRTIARFDNTYYFFIYYFGAIGLFLSLSVASFFFLKAFQRNLEDVLPWFLISLMIFFTGGGFAPRFIFFFIFMVLVLSKIPKELFEDKGNDAKV